MDLEHINCKIVNKNFTKLQTNRISLYSENVYLIKVNYYKKKLCSPWAKKGRIISCSILLSLTITAFASQCYINKYLLETVHILHVALNISMSKTIDTFSFSIYGKTFPRYRL